MQLQPTDRVETPENWRAGYDTREYLVIQRTDRDHYIVEAHANGPLPQWYVLMTQADAPHALPLACRYSKHSPSQSAVDELIEESERLAPRRER